VTFIICEVDCKSKFVRCAHPVLDTSFGLMPFTAVQAVSSRRGRSDSGLERSFISALQGNRRGIVLRVTNSTEQGPSWEADSYSASQEITRARHWSLFWARWILFTTSHKIHSNNISSIYG